MSPRKGKELNKVNIDPIPSMVTERVERKMNKSNLLIPIPDESVIALSYATTLGKMYPDRLETSHSNYNEYNLFSLRTQLLPILKDFNLSPTFLPFEIRGKSHIVVTVSHGAKFFTPSKEIISTIREKLSYIDDTYLLVLSDDLYRELKVPKWWLHQIIEYLPRSDFSFVEDGKYYIKLQSDEYRESLRNFRDAPDADVTPTEEKKFNPPAVNFNDIYNSVHDDLISNIKFLFKTGSMVCDVDTDLELINSWQLTSWNNSPVFYCDWVDTRFENNKTRFLYERRYKNTVLFHLGDNRIYRHVLSLFLNKNKTYFYFLRNIAMIECNDYLSAVHFANMIEKIKATVSGVLDFCMNIDFPISTSDNDTITTCYRCFDRGNGPWVISKLKSFNFHDTPKLIKESKYLFYNIPDNIQVERLYNGIYESEKNILSKDYAIPLTFSFSDRMTIPQALNCINFLQFYLFSRYGNDLNMNYRISQDLERSDKSEIPVLDVVMSPMFKMDDFTQEPIMVSIYDRQNISRLNPLDFKDLTITDPLICVVTDNYIIKNNFVCIRDSEVPERDKRRAAILSNNYSNFCRSENSVYDEDDIISICRRFNMDVLPNKKPETSTCIYYKRDPNIDMAKILSDFNSGVPYIYFLTRKSDDYSQYIDSIQLKYTQEYVNLAQIEDIDASISQDIRWMSFFPGDLIAIPVRCYIDIEFFESFNRRI